MANEPAREGSDPVAGVILAGGLSKRMGGGDKSLLDIGGRSMLAAVVDRLANQAWPLVINANGDPARFAGFNLPIFSDPIRGYIGPLAGILGGMRWAQEKSKCRWIVTVPTDTPFFPRDLVERLVAGVTDAEIAVACSLGRSHPVVALWSIQLARDLDRWLLDPTHRGVDAWVKSRRYLEITFDGEGGLDPFFNVNTPQDTLIAAARAKSCA